MRIGICTTVLLLLVSSFAGAAEFFVSPKGSDKNPGTSAKPFATLRRARDAIREMKKQGPLPQGGVTVWVGRGTYPILSTLKLTEEDSGTKDAPIIYRATDEAGTSPASYRGRIGIEASSSRYGSYAGAAVDYETKSGTVSLGVQLPIGRRSGGGAMISIGGAPRRSRSDRSQEQDDTVRLIGGREITGFQPMHDLELIKRLDPGAQGKVLRADLKALGITDFGALTVRGFGRGNSPSALELFFDGRPMTLAGWPNDGWIETTSVPAGPNGGKFGYDGDRPSRWRKSDDIWVHGYWTWPWADSYEHVKSIDTQARVIETHPPHGVYGYQEHKRFRFLNVLEELDSPGEYYLDRDSGMLYFWPPDRKESGRAIVSLIREPMIELAGASYVTFRGFTIEACRGTAIEINGGTHNLIAGCTLRNIGNLAVSIGGGTANGVIGCDIYETGDGGVNLSGGDRATLTPAGNFVENCDIHDFSRWVRTYRPAVLISGVGNRVAHCHLYNAPHTAILLRGNDNTIEFNDIHDMCRETGDAGAFYMGRDWTMRGNIVRYNYFHHLGGFNDKFSKHNFSDTMAVYLDDWASGTRVYGNLFYKANRAVMIGGGRDNTVQNNIFVDCRISVHVDARGIAKWTASYWDGTNNTMFDRLKAVNGTKPPYSTRYPQLANILEDEPRLPKGNSITRNISVGSDTWIKWVETFDHSIVDIRDNIVDSEPGFSDPLFIDRAKMDFRLKPESPALKLGFRQLPLDRIGLYSDEYRKAAARTPDIGGQ